MDGQRQRVLETLTEPDLIQQGDFGELLAVRFYHRTPVTSKFLVVVYREISDEDGFILTAYLTGAVALISQRGRTVILRREAPKNLVGVMDSRPETRCLLRLHSAPQKPLLSMTDRGIVAAVRR